MRSIQNDTPSAPKHSIAQLKSRVIGVTVRLAARGEFLTLPTVFISQTPLRPTKSNFSPSAPVPECAWIFQSTSYRQKCSVIFVTHLLVVLPPKTPELCVTCFVADSSSRSTVLMNSQISVAVNSNEMVFVLLYSFSVARFSALRPQHTSRALRKDATVPLTPYSDKAYLSS